MYIPLDAHSTDVLQAMLHALWIPGTTASPEADAIRREIERRRIRGLGARLASLREGWEDPQGLRLLPLPGKRRME